MKFIKHLFAVILIVLPVVAFPFKYTINNNTSSACMISNKFTYRGDATLYPNTIPSQQTGHLRIFTDMWSKSAKLELTIHCGGKNVTFLLEEAKLNQSREYSTIFQVKKADSGIRASCADVPGSKKEKVITISS